MERLVQKYKRRRPIRKYYSIEPLKKNKKCDTKLHHFQFYSSKSKSFYVKYLESENCKIQQIAYLKCL